MSVLGIGRLFVIRVVEVFWFIGIYFSSLGFGLLKEEKVLVFY